MKGIGEWMAGIDLREYASGWRVARRGSRAGKATSPNTAHLHMALLEGR